MFSLFNPSIRVTEAASSSFPFFGKYWHSSCTASLSAAIGTCPLVDGVRVIVYSLPASSFSEIVVSVDAASGNDDARQLQAARVPARCCTHTNIDVEITRDVQLVPFLVKIVPSRASSDMGASAYMEVPESKAAADALTACWANRHRMSSGILLHGPAGCGKTACVKHVLASSMIPHEYFDCATMYAHDGSLFAAAVSSVAKKNRRGPMYAGGGDGAVLVLDRLDCMFCSLSPHAQVTCRSFFVTNFLMMMACFSFTNAARSRFACLQLTN